MITHTEHRSRLRKVDLESGRIAYVDEGQGPVIVLVHGVPTSSWLYRHMIPLFTEKGYRVIALDLLGFGASDKPKGYEVYSEQNQGKRILALMNHLQINSWTHVCHDAGGLWTWEMLRENPSVLDGLIILNTIIYEPGFKPPLRYDKGWRAKLYTAAYSWWLTHRFLINATLNNGLRKGIKLEKKDKKG